MRAFRSSLDITDYERRMENVYINIAKTLNPNATIFERWTATWMLKKQYQMSQQIAYKQAQDLGLMPPRPCIPLKRYGLDRTSNNVVFHTRVLCYSYR